MRSTSSFWLILHDPRNIHYIQERFLLRYRANGRSDPESLRSLVLGRALPWSLSTVQDVINLSCRHFHHASSLCVASESARCTNCENCDNLPIAPFHKTFDCLASSSSRTFLPSRDRFSRLFPLPGRRAVGVMAFTRRVRLKRELVSALRARLK